MKKGFVSLNLVVDMSGSMAPMKTDTINGINGFLEEQRTLPGDAILTLCMFNSDYNLLHESVPIKSVPNLTSKDYCPNGWTALLDALGKTIESTEKKIEKMNEEDRPEKVLFMIITDGEENASSQFKIEKIKEMVTKHQQFDSFPWEFVFVGASSIDAFSVGSSIGVASSNAIGYEATSHGTSALYSSVTKGVSNYRGTAEKFDVLSVQNLINKS